MFERLSLAEFLGAREMDTSRFPSLLTRAIGDVLFAYSNPTVRPLARRNESVGVSTVSFELPLTHQEVLGRLHRLGLVPIASRKRLMDIIAWPDLDTQKLSFAMRHLLCPALYTGHEEGCPAFELPDQKEGPHAIGRIMRVPLVPFAHDQGYLADTPFLVEGDGRYTAEPRLAGEVGMHHVDTVRLVPALQRAISELFVIPKPQRIFSQRGDVFALRTHFRYTPLEWAAYLKEKSSVDGLMTADELIALIDSLHAARGGALRPTFPFINDTLQFACPELACGSDASGRVYVGSLDIVRIKDEAGVVYPPRMGRLELSQGEGVFCLPRATR